MKNQITVERLKELVKEFMVLEKDEFGHSSEWAYVMLEPALIECYEVTLKYLKQIDKDEFIALGENHWFSVILTKFKSLEMLNIILSQYKIFFGESIDTEFYRDSIKGLENCIKSK